MVSGASDYAVGMCHGCPLRLCAMVACQVVDHYLVCVGFDPVLSQR